MITKKTGTRGKDQTPRRGARSKPRTKRPEQDPAQQIALAVAAAALDKKALNVEIIDVRGKVDYADYVVVMSGRSERQVSAITRGVQETLAKTLGRRCLGVEGLTRGTWVLLDYGDIIVHVFHEDVRGYYDVESLWVDAARVEQRLAAGVD